MKIYFAGSIRGGRDDAQIYADIIKLLQSYGEVLTEHVGEASLKSDGETKLSEEHIYSRDTDWIRQADIVVAEVTQPSLGVGYELAYAESLQIPVVCLFRTDAERKLSAMIRGNKYFQVHEYSSTQDLTKRMPQILA